MRYSCLEVLAQRPGLSNAELARATFVTRQAMNGVLRGLQDRGLVSRAASASYGRALSTQLTATGRQHQRRLRNDLAACTSALTAKGGQTQ